MSGREKIAARIRALRAKTVENGCTEEEAISAAEKLAELLARYNMTVDEAEMRSSPFDRHHERHADDVGERIWKVAGAAAYLTGSQYWVSRPGVHPVEINFFGFEHEVEISRYLLEICARALRQHRDTLERKHRLLVPAARRRQVLPFLDGMADRLLIRIKALKPTEPTGSGLVVLRNALITQAMKDAGIELDSGRVRPSRDGDEAYAQGWLAGADVALNSGLRGPGAAAGLLG